MNSKREVATWGFGMTGKHPKKREHYFRSLSSRPWVGAVIAEYYYEPADYAHGVTDDVELCALVAVDPGWQCVVDAFPDSLIHDLEAEILEDIRRAHRSKN